MRTFVLRMTATIAGLAAFLFVGAFGLEAFTPRVVAAVVIAVLAYFGLDRLWKPSGGTAA